jgi:hypothetical protein
MRARTPLIFGVWFVGMGSLTVVPVENRRGNVAA